MENRFTNFNKAKEEATIKNTLKVNSDHPSEVEKKKTYSFTLLPSEREMLKILATKTDIKVSDSQYLGSLIRSAYDKSLKD